MFFLCPVCKSELNKRDNSLYCLNGHCFDCHKSGYVNLLFRSSGGNHGDNKLMINARRDFLDKGYYKPFCDAAADAVKRYCKKDGVVLDCGCGEGYYTSAIKENTDCEVFGFDISKYAVLTAAKRNREIKLAVASSFDIPFPDGGADVITEIFSPFCVGEFKRVLKSGGYMIMGIPLENHLYSLKQAVYDEPYKNETADFSIDGFELVENKEIKYKFELTGNEDIKNLFMMTPYYYKTGRNEQSRLNTLQVLSVEAEFSVLVYKKL